LDQLKELMASYLEATVFDIPPYLYRARIQSDSTPYSLDGMGKPPQELSTHGRANPAGIPYLYLASDSKTAISEVRPLKGDLVCVATLKIPSGLRIVNLCNPKKTVSPLF